MQKNVTHSVFSGKIVKIIVLIIKRSYIIGDIKANHTALRKRRNF